MNVAILITLLRFPVLLCVALLLYLGEAAGQAWAAGLILVLILMDTADGVVARWRHEETLIGSALDIAADRTVEIVLWVIFAHLGLVPVLVPLLVIVRGALTDSVRGAALQYGYSAHDMMRSRLGHWLVASPPMRTGYALTKVTAFVTLAAALSTRGSSSYVGVWRVGVGLAWAAVSLCIIRGLPVLIEAPRFLRGLRTGAEPKPLSAKPQDGK
jgi:CDP-diacylglycerol--glycerol-3-phosphate 3-phosphatidyltransferase